MSKEYLVIVFILINIATLYGQLSPSEHLFIKNVNCDEECTKSFAPHTYPNGSDSAACMQGCRLYIINKFLAASNTNLPNTDEIGGPSLAKKLCFDACIEAYNETSSNSAACKVGCNNQKAIFRANESDEPDVSGFHLLKPVMQVREVINKVVGMLHIIQSTITTYFISDDDKLVAVEGPVKLMVQVVPPELQEEQEMETLQQRDNLAQESALLVNGASSFECFSRRVGIPPYLLVVSLFSFIISLAYLVFIICSSSKKQKAKSGLPIPSHALPVKLVRPEDLTKLSLIDEEESQQALPLPTKVKLPDTII